jgi:hypothetical protein
MTMPPNEVPSLDAAMTLLFHILASRARRE